jgi:hypothetical protein
VDALAQRNFAVDLLEKFQPLTVGVFLGGVSDLKTQFSTSDASAFSQSPIEISTHGFQLLIAAE